MAKGVFVYSSYCRAQRPKGSQRERDTFRLSVCSEPRVWSRASTCRLCSRGCNFFSRAETRATRFLARNPEIPEPRLLPTAGSPEDRRNSCVVGKKHSWLSQNRAPGSGIDPGPSFPARAKFLANEQTWDNKMWWSKVLFRVDINFVRYYEGREIKRMQSWFRHGINISVFFKRKGASKTRDDLDVIFVSWIKISLLCSFERSRDYNQIISFLYYSYVIVVLCCKISRSGYSRYFCNPRAS